MKIQSLLFALLGMSFLGIAFFTFTSSSETKITPTKSATKAQRIEDAWRYDFEITKDPKLGYPPRERLLTAIEETQQLQQEFAIRKNAFQNARFRERGPNNIAGRTRALLIDVTDPERKTFWAGSVSGGLWKTDDITAAQPNWRKINDYMENLAVGAIVQDPNRPNLMLMGTGEGFPNGDAVDGIGIFRSLDNGETWDLLPSTTGGNFDNTRQMIVHPSGMIYAATTSGLYRTADAGDSWEKVLGREFNAVNSAFDVEYNERGDYLYAATPGDFYRSRTGAPGTWENLSNPDLGYPQNFTRTEFTVSISNPNIIYLVGNDRGIGSNIYRSEDGGINWEDRGPVNPDTDFTRGQVWYDLDIAVDPSDEDHVFVGGIDIYETKNGAASWSRISDWRGFGRQFIHADQHRIIFDPEIPNRVFIGNDGGVFYSDDKGRTFTERNTGYNVTQFYAGAIHPDAYSDYILGGTQDNNSLQMNAVGVTGARPVLGGDGMICHIDQANPENQIVSYQFGNYFLSKDGGNTFEEGASVGGSFVNPSDFDEDTKTLYTQTFDGDYAFWRIANKTPISIDVRNVDLQVTLVQVDPFVRNRVYLGTRNTGVVRIDNATSRFQARATVLGAPGVGSVSSIAIDPNDANHLVVTYSNYGINHSVLESKDAGKTFANIEGNLPDMPVRFSIINPDQPEQAVIATEAGVWFTEKMQGDSTVWIPPAQGMGSPIVRTDMLKYRASDKQILAATHGRGMFVSDVFSDPAALMDFFPISYQDANVQFSAEPSLKAEAFDWMLGDGATAESEITNNVYEESGDYTIELTTNEELTIDSNLRVLPILDLPYVQSFEEDDLSYGVVSLNGTAFNIGTSTFPGKSGSRSGSNAVVLGTTDSLYAANTTSLLYLPEFDFSEEGIYEFSFFAKADIRDSLDGYRVEYSLNQGVDWEVLGDIGDNWYDMTDDFDFRRNNSFEVGTPYFGTSSNGFEEHFLNISELSGEEKVAFRIIFRSHRAPNTTASGIAIDDVKISKFDGDLQTEIISLDANAIGRKARVEWQTTPEFRADRFIIERSYNGRDFQEVAEVDAIGKTTLRPQLYDLSVDFNRNVAFYRIRSINEEVSEEYYYEFTTPVVIVRKDGVSDLELAFPNPFNDFLNLTFNNLIEQEVNLRLYDAAGRLMYEYNQVPDAFFLSIPTSQLAQGVYFLQYRVGEQQSEVVRLVKNE
ncbi:MAG: T9SS type A sorting domain-containing protein [Bacteroidota bacterium]